MSNVVPIRKSSEAILHRIRELADDSLNVIVLESIDYPEDAGAARKHIYDCLKTGKIDSVEHNSEGYEVKMSKYAAGLKVIVTVLLETGEKRLLVLHGDYGLMM